MQVHNLSLSSGWLEFLVLKGKDVKNSLNRQNDNSDYNKTEKKSHRLYYQFPSHKVTSKYHAAILREYSLHSNCSVQAVSARTSVPELID